MPSPAASLARLVTVWQDDNAGFPMIMHVLISTYRVCGALFAYIFDYVERLLCPWKRV